MEGGTAMNETMIMIQDKADRRQVAAILTDNGYTVKPVKVKIGKIKRIALAFSREDTDTKGEESKFEV